MHPDKPAFGKHYDIFYQRPGQERALLCTLAYRALAEEAAHRARRDPWYVDARITVEQRACCRAAS